MRTIIFYLYVLYVLYIYFNIIDIRKYVIKKVIYKI